MVNVTVQFSGGMELLFDGKRELEVTLTSKDNSPCKVKHLIVHLRDNIILERPELFAQGDTV
ncbi:Ubiquitin- modifier 1, partial [Nowakowskiella sp. JEL0078]